MATELRSVQQVQTRRTVTSSKRQFRPQKEHHEELWTFDNRLGKKELKSFEILQCFCSHGKVVKRFIFNDRYLDHKSD